jgi:hypothetical protein
VGGENPAPNAENEIDHLDKTIKKTQINNPGTFSSLLRYTCGLEAP